MWNETTEPDTLSESTAAAETDVISELAKAEVFAQFDKAMDCTNNPELQQTLVSMSLVLLLSGLSSAHVELVVDTCKNFYAHGAIAMAKTMAEQIQKRKSSTTE